MLGIRVEDIMSKTRSQLHFLTSFGRVRRNRITYPISGASRLRFVARSIEEQSEENGGMNGSEGSCGRRGWDSFENVGERPADTA